MASKRDEKRPRGRATTGLATTAEAAVKSARRAPPAAGRRGRSGGAQSGGARSGGAGKERAPGRTASARKEPAADAKAPLLAEASASIEAEDVSRISLERSPAREAPEEPASRESALLESTTVLEPPASKPPAPSERERSEREEVRLPEDDDDGDWFTPPPRTAERSSEDGDGAGETLEDDPARERLLPLPPAAGENGALAPSDPEEASRSVTLDDLFPSSPSSGLPRRDDEPRGNEPWGNGAGAFAGPRPGVVADEVVGDGGPAADARAEPGVSTPRVGAPAPAAPGPRGDGFQQHGQGRRGKHRRSGRSNFPRVPDGPPGLVYVVDSSSPIGATGSLRVYYRQVAQGGATVLHPVPVDRQMSRRSQHPLDHRVASVLIRLPKQGKNYIRTKRGWRGKKGRGRRHGWQMDQRAVTVTEKTWRTLLPWLVESQRFYLALPGSNETVPIVREELSPLEFHLLIERIRKRGDFHLTCRFLRGSRTLLYKSQVLLVTEGERGWLLRRSGKMSNVDFSGSVAWLRALRRGRFRHVPRRKVSSLLKIFERSTTLPPVHFPSSLKVTRLEGYLPRPELKLESGPQEVTGEVTFRYGEDVVRAARPGKRFFSLKNRRLIERDLKVEAEHAVELLQHGFTYDNNTHGFSLSADLLATAAPQLFELGWTLHGKRMPFRPPTDMDVDVTTGPDYIDVSVTVHFGDQKVELPQLLQAMREGSRMIVLGQGAVGVLPGEWLDRNAGWMELGKLHEGKLRFRRNQSALIDALAADKIRARLDKGFKAERERLANFEGIHECEPPEGFKGTLRPYQKFGLGWLRFLDQMAWGGCLADDMGLGKTVQALALLLHVKNEGRTGTTLIVTPKSLIFNWLREAKRFTPKLKVTSYTGPKRHSLFDSLSSYDIVLTTYGTVRRDAEKLAGVSFFYLILDEAQAIKNADSQNAKAASLLSGERRLILSGTPVENHLGELWSLFDFINPGMLGTYSAFRKRFGGDRGIDSSSLAFLRRTLRPFILRRKKEEVATDLPPRVEETIMCELDEEQKKVYAEVKERCRNSVLRHVKAQGMARSKLHILEALLRMRQAACHPALISEEYANVSSGKIGAALSMLDEIEDAGHKALVFSQFTSLLAIVRKELEAKGKKLGRDYEYLDGQTRNRGERVDHFQGDPDCRFFLISLKAGGLGLNLTAADYVFILDPWWNPAVEAQAIDRAHRIGQEKKVFAYRFVSQESIEERIAELQESKRKLADAIVSEDDSLIRDLTKEDLEVLFS